jgi:hypothetical protein
MGKAIDTIKKLNAVTFDWKSNNEHDLGLIAEDVAKIIPEAIYYKDGKIEGIRIMPIIAIMIEAIKELNNGE